MIERLSRRSLLLTGLTGAAGIAVGFLPTLPALAIPTPATSSLLILEHRRRAEHMFMLADLFHEWFDASPAALRAELSDPDEVFEASLIARRPWRAPLSRSPTTRRRLRFMSRQSFCAPAALSIRAFLFLAAPMTRCFSRQ